jgi:hypothetical protein
MFKPSITLVVDPRFPGGTSSAVARELYALVGAFELEVVFYKSSMFRGDTINPKIDSACMELGIETRWSPSIVKCRNVVFHNPASLKFDADFPIRIVAENFIVVAHENFMKPDGEEGFDVAHCLGLLSKATVAKRWSIAPVSNYCRTVVGRWLAQHEVMQSQWSITTANWINICDFETFEPNPKPRDRRGRFSRAGFEKFDTAENMLRQYPPHAEACKILGADSFLLDPKSIPSHWEMLAFGSINVSVFLNDIDFFVYYTHPNLAESFGRVVAEAVASGKLVITDHRLAQSFPEMCIAAESADIDAIIQRYCSNPKDYVAFVKNAQTRLSDFSSEKFLTDLYLNLTISGDAA